MTQTSITLENLPGIAGRRAAAFQKLGYETIEDLLYHFPFRYEDRRLTKTIDALSLDQPPATLQVDVRSSRLIRTRRRGFTIFEAELFDETGSVTAIWFNQPYLARSMTAGKRLFVYGSLAKRKMRKQPILENPEFETIADGDLEGVHTGRIVPVYRKLGTAGSKMLRRIMWTIVQQSQDSHFDELIPKSLLHLVPEWSRREALVEVHFPGPDAAIEALNEKKSSAHRRLALEECYLVQLALATRRSEYVDAASRAPYSIDQQWERKALQRVPFELTNAQKRVLSEIKADLTSSSPMYRLLQGDVGSGKTIVAFLAMEMARASGRQAALVAPTEILADQHRANLEEFLGEDRSTLGYLVGSLTPKARRPVLDGFQNGQRAFAIGTHALFEPGVQFNNLGLVVVDEQQRFGVQQRESLVSKGEATDVLVMTATPIPRSLALTLWGDLDLSVLDERPPGRRPIKTAIRRESGRQKVYEGLRQQLKAGRQAYVVVPRVEVTEKEDLKAAVRMQAELAKGPLKDFTVGLLHGKMKSVEKDDAMTKFVEGKTDVLVSTTVVEVGVDVPNATVMIIEQAERFGLAQLHQLRGRIGRSDVDSYCILMVSDQESDIAARRLSVMAETEDGFRISEEDLRLRGPGAILGTHQSGISDLQFVALVLGEPGWVSLARQEALRQVSTPERLKAAQDLLQSLRPNWQRRLAWAGIG